MLPDDSARIGAAVADAAGRADLVIVIAGSSAGRDDHTAEVIGAGRRRCSCTASPCRPGHPVVLGRVGGDRGAGRAGISRLRRADLRDLRAPAPRRARGRGAGRAAACPRPAGTAAGLLARRRRLDPRPARPRRRRARRDAAPPRRRRPHLAGARRRPARRARRARGPRRRHRGRGAAAARPRRRRAHDRRDRVARSGARPRRVAAPRPQPAADARERHRRLAQRARRAARRPLPLLRLPPARSRERPLHAAVDRARHAGAGGRGDPPRTPRAGAHRRGRQPARHRRTRRPAAPALRQPPARARAPVSCSTTSSTRPASTRRRSPATSARSRRISRSPPP